MGELASLLDEELKHSVELKQSQIPIDYKELITPLQKQYPGRFVKYTEELYKWSRTIVETRVFSLPGVDQLVGATNTVSEVPPTYVMLPLADLLNHSPGPECDMAARALASAA